MFHSQIGEPVHDAKPPVFASSPAGPLFRQYPAAQKPKASKRAQVPSLTPHLRLLVLEPFQVPQETWPSNRRVSFLDRDAAARGEYHLLNVRISFVGIQFPSDSLFNRIQIAHKFPTPLPRSIALGASITLRQFLKLFFQFLRVRHRIHRKPMRLRRHMRGRGRGRKKLLLA